MPATPFLVEGLPSIKWQKLRIEDTIREIFEVEAAAEESHNPFSAIPEEPPCKRPIVKIVLDLKEETGKRKFWGVFLLLKHQNKMLN